MRTWGLLGLSGIVIPSPGKGIGTNEVGESGGTPEWYWLSSHAGSAVRIFGSMGLNEPNPTVASERYESVADGVIGDAWVEENCSKSV